MTRRIGVDARALLDPRPTGVERVLRAFVEALPAVDRDDLEWLLFVDRDPHGRLPAGWEARTKVVPPPRAWPRALGDAWIARRMARAFDEHALHGFLSPNTKFPLGRPRCFTMVHGLEWWTVPDAYPRGERLRQRAWLRLAAARSAGTITFSETTAADLRRFAPDARAPACVVGEGVSPAFHGLADRPADAAVLARLGIRPPYVLAVSSHEPRKNLARLVRAFALAGADHRLVLVGRPGWRHEDLVGEARRSGCEARVVLPGWVTDDELLELYAGARAFALPSRYEGFGLPVLEALAAGLPTLTGARGATAEVAGDAALLVDPEDDAALATGLGRLLGDERLRARLAAAGPARTAAYTWGGMTRRIVAFLERSTRT